MTWREIEMAFQLYFLCTCRQASSGAITADDTARMARDQMLFRFGSELAPIPSPISKSFLLLFFKKEVLSFSL
jgi:hypothetical protein